MVKLAIQDSLSNSWKQYEAHNGKQQCVTKKDTDGQDNILVDVKQVAISPDLSHGISYKRFVS